MITAHDAEVTGSVRKPSLLNVLYPCAKHTDRDPVFFFTRDRAGVTADTSVDYKSVAHGANLTL